MWCLLLLPTITESRWGTPGFLDNILRCLAALLQYTTVDKTVPPPQVRYFNFPNNPAIKWQIYQLVALKDHFKQSWYFVFAVYWCVIVQQKLEKNHISPAIQDILSMRNAQIGLRLWILNGGLKCQCFIHSSSSTKQFDKHISLSFIAMQPGRLEVVSLTASESKSKFVPTVILEQKTADFYSKFFCIHQSSNRMQGQCYFSTKLMHRSQAKFLWVRKQDFVPIKVGVLNIDHWIKIRFTTSGEYYVSVQGCW